MVTAIGHLDADCFYVSAERVRDSFLLGKSVGVLGNQGACVIAKSYEMKAAGVATGMPIWDARRLCPEGIYIKRDFRWYEVLSRRMLGLVREYSSRVEYYSIDECFFRAEVGRGRAASNCQDLAERLRDRVWSELRVPVTVGIARSRTLAKLISDAAKPFGALAILDRVGERQLLERLPVTEVTGIAGRRARRLEPWRIRNCLEFVHADRGLIRQLLTASGEALWWELRGDPVFPINPQRVPHKSLSRGGNFDQASDDPHVIYAWLVRNLERLIEELTYHQVLAGQLTIWVSYRDGAVGVSTRDLTVATDRFEDLLEVARPCLRDAWRPHQAAKRMQVIAERLQPQGQMQLSLFESPETRVRAEQRARLKHEVNQQYGRFAVRSGATLPLAHIYQDQVNGYDICDIRGKSCF